MKTLQNILISLSILTIGNFSYSDWANDIVQYYSTPYDAESYIDSNKGISMESYIHTNINPFPGPLKEGSAQNYPFPNRQERKEIYFQPSDGSMTNGVYEINSKTATTALHEYDNVIVINGTLQPPQLNNQGKYIDKNNIALEPIGSMHVPVEDASPSDIQTYYLFGKIIPAATKTTTKNNPTQDYNSQGE